MGRAVRTELVRDAHPQHGPGSWEKPVLNLLVIQDEEISKGLAGERFAVEERQRIAQVVAIVEGGVATS